MYRLGRRASHHYIIYGLILLVGAGLVIGGTIVSRAALQAHTVLTQSSPVTHVVTPNSVSLQHLSNNSFDLDLPVGWQSVEPPQLPYTIYSWAGRTGVDAARRLDVYIDRVPNDLAVNRLLPVAGDSDHFDVTGTVSDNCVNFTDKTVDSQRSGVATSKWGGVNFLCDMGNYERDVVATGSNEGVDVATLHNLSGAAHHVMLVYRDNNANPDYTIFVTIVKSFRVD